MRAPARPAARRLRGSPLQRGRRCRSGTIRGCTTPLDGWSPPATSRPGERLDEGLPTSGLVVIDFAGKDWRKLHLLSGRLERFMSPRSLAEADRA
jgi:hypothetical protein